MLEVLRWIAEAVSALLLGASGAVLGWLAALGDDKLVGAVILALLTAVVGAVGYILRGLITWIGGLLAVRAHNRMVFKRFRAEVAVARRTLPPTVSHVYERSFLAMMERLDRTGPRFKVFSATLNEIEVKDAMRAIAHRFSVREMETIDQHVYYAKFLDRFYERLQSDEFAKLETSRKVRVVKTYFRYARDHCRNVRKLARMLDRHPWASRSLPEALVRGVVRLLVQPFGGLHEALERLVGSWRLRRAKRKLKASRINLQAARANRQQPPLG